MTEQRDGRGGSAAFSHDDTNGNLTWAFGVANALAPNILQGDTPGAASILGGDVSAEPLPQQIVFIEGNVPDAALLAAGVAPGVRAVVLDAAQDGVQQVAAYLARHNITNLAAIDLVAHGADGVLQLGSAQLSSATIGGYQEQLAAIGAALRPGGDIQLYGCDVAQDGAGDAFLQQLSQATGGANIAASSHLVGAAAGGGNWSLNVDVGTMDVSSPFTAAAMSAYPDVLSTTANQIVIGLWNDQTGSGAAGTRAEQFGVSGSGMISGSTVDLADGSQSNASVLSGSQITGVGVDTALNTYFVAVDDASTNTLSIQKGSFSGGGLSAFYTLPIQDLGGSTSTVGVLGGLAVDAQHGTLYYALAGEDINTGSPVAQYTGIFKISVSGGSPSAVTSSGASLTQPAYLALDTADNLLFFDDAILAGGSFPAVNNLDEVNLTTGSVTVLRSFANSDTNFLLTGMDINASSHMLYLTTADFTSSSTNANAILSIPFSVSGTGSSANASIGAISTLYSGSGAFRPSDIVIDPAHSIFYTSGDDASGDGAVYEGSLSGGSSLTLVQSSGSTFSSGASAHISQLVLLSQPTVSISGTVTAITGGGTVAVDPTATVTDPSGQLESSATISGVLSGDTLNYNGGGAKIFGDGGIIAPSFSNGTLILSGAASAADYQSALDAVTLSTTSETATARTLNWTINDGVVLSPSTTSTVAVHVNPTVTAGATVSFTGGGAAVVLDSSLNVSDASSTTLVSASIVLAGSIAGDQLNFTNQNGIAGSYSNGTLSLSGNASVSNYKTALASVTYSTNPSNTDPTGGGTHNSRTIDWSVNDGTLTASTATSTLNLLHAPPTVTAGGSATYPESAAPVVLDGSLSVSDADSGGMLIGATVSINAGFLNGDTLSFTPHGSITGTYTAANGLLTLSGTDTIANYQSVLDSVSYSFSGDPTHGGSDTSRTIAWTVSDGAASNSPAATSALTTLCFCAGTQIRTPDGETRVEHLAIGDSVVTASGAVRQITWIGVGQLLATPGKRGDATPVIVARHALAHDVPHRDLRVTKGHSLYLDGLLIPVEFLVNHRSIRWDDRAEEVALYHIELDSHDVLLANGAPAESYRDDGNRVLFRNANPAWHLASLPPCAPVLTGGPVVDAVWRRLLDRSGPRKLPPLTDDPDLHLVVDGRRVDAATRQGDAWLFRLPSRPASVRIVSRDAVPAELGLARDFRSLGVAVQRIVLRQGGSTQVIDAANPQLVNGFHSFEPGGGDRTGHRWTKGDAALPPALLAEIQGSLELELLLGGRTRYLADADLPRAA